MLTQTLVLIGFLGAAMALMAIRVIFVKGAEFRGTCATNNPMIKDKHGDCTMCGAKSEADCRDKAH